ncbi:MAG TPA: DUF3576 domain-containing protein [Alphaproteobacteria bacterium]|nr:DUF3576 domain-containing protein [Alphaproteobacteria bacterium]
MNKKHTISLLILSFLTGCSSLKDEQEKAPEHSPKSRYDEKIESPGYLFGDDFLSFGGSRKKTAGQGAGPSSVNTYLWKASLEALNLMPLQSADAVGGVLITEWYASTPSSQDKIKVCVFIKDYILRADALKVTVYKQVKDKSGHWLSSSLDEVTARQIEDIILTKARDLRNQAKQANKL